MPEQIDVKKLVEYAIKADFKQMMTAVDEERLVFNVGLEEKARRIYVVCARCELDGPIGLVGPGWRVQLRATPDFRLSRVGKMAGRLNLEVKAGVERRVIPEFVFLFFRFKGSHLESAVGVFEV